MGRKEEQKKIEDGKELENAIQRTRYEKFQHQTFIFLEQPSNRWAVAYHILNLCFILVSIIVSVLSTIDTFENDPTFHSFTFVFEIGLLVWFTLEYIFRAWSCSVLKRYRGWRGRLKFLKNFYMCVDAFIITSTTITSLLQVDRSYFTILRATRFLQVFRILRVDRQKGDLGMMLRIVIIHRRELITCYFAGFIILFGGAYIVYMLENQAEGAMITDMLKGIYWGLITVTSVGYGDLSPVTWSGKFVTGLYGLIGCAFFGLPAGILGSGFAIQQAKQKSQQNLLKIRNPAALLIQNLWRTYATNRNQTRFHATWDNLLPLITGNVQWPGYYSCLPGITAICNSKEFHGFKVGVPKVEFRKNSIITPFENFTAGIDFDSTKKQSFSRARPSTTSLRKMSRGSVRKKSSGPSGVNTTLMRNKHAKLAKYRAAIQFILRIKYWCCIYHFKRQRNVEIEMTDVWEKNAQIHQETISFLREMKGQTIRLKTELNFMKTTFSKHLSLKLHQDTATLSQKKARGEHLRSGVREELKKSLMKYIKNNEEQNESKAEVGEEEEFLNDDVFLKPPPPAS